MDWSLQLRYEGMLSPWMESITMRVHLMMTSEPIHIEKGPDKWELMVALFECNPTHRRTVCFDVQNGQTTDRPFEKLEVAIIALEQEDNSGKAWLFKGYLKGRDPRRGRIYGFYSTQTRAGWYKRGKAAY